MITEDLILVVYFSSCVDYIFLTLVEVWEFLLAETCE